ncbi:ABC transporter substrate-binding protein [Yinghuangia sp. ASG 101]|uniref:ABC transporter substrate-binding protein n=1 Tax=Yinghuangia sp. ASG 101 TaxID=2896848 RepID=UPI001E49B36D|nr:ABC transporter substrate-binding protein [Yinghuangia sp. ASG 101]UGQ12577.1 ABC transporter substrate-binding protein [Yinghuangia sp. ASG 101]
MHEFAALTRSFGVCGEIGGPVFTRDQVRRRRSRGGRRIRVAWLALVMVVAAACGSSGGAPNPNATPRHGGGVTVLLPGDARGLDPYTANIANQADGSRLSALYDVLLWSDPATGTVRPQMAESLIPDRDGLVWTLTLKGGIRFGDGAKLDAMAVKRAWEKHKDPALQSPAAVAVAPLKLAVLDELRLRIELPSANANFDRTVAHSLNFVPSPRTLDSPEAFAASRTAPVGAGPYRLREWVPGSHMTFERNPDYWQQGKPYLDTVTFRVDAETTAAAKAIDAKDADIVVSSDPVLLVQARGLGLPVDEIPLNGGQMLAFNTRKLPGRPLADPNLRRAVALSLNGDEINRLYSDGKGRLAKGIFASSSPIANIQLTMPQNDPTQAAALFAAATDNGGKPLKLVFAVPSTPKAVAMAEYMKERIESVSSRQVRVDLVVEDIVVYSKRVLFDADFDIATYGLWAEDAEPLLYQFLHSSGGPTNLTGYQNPEVDSALEAARLSTDRTVRNEAYTRVQMRLINDVPFFVFLESLAGCVTSPDLTGAQLFNDGLLLWDRVGRRG